MRFRINLKNFEGVERFYKAIINLESDIDVSIDRYIVDGHSLLGLLSLNVSKELLLTIHEKNAGDAAKLRQILEENDFLVGGA